MIPSRRTLLGLAVSAIFLLLFLRQLDGLHLGEVLSGVDYRWLLVAVPVFFAGGWCRTLRWQALLHSIHPVGAGVLFPYVIIGYMANNLLPARAGEVVRAYLTGARLGIGQAPLLGTIALERVSDGLTLLLFMAIAGLVWPLGGWLTSIAVAGSLLFLGGLGALCLALATRRRAWRLWQALGGRLPLPLRGRLAALAGGLLDGMVVLRNPRLLAVVALQAVLAWGWEALVFYFTGLALGLDVPVIAYVLAMCTANLATALPSSQAGVGLFEFFCAETLQLYGLAAPQAAAFAILVHVVLVAPVVLAGLVCLARANLSLGAVLQRSSQPAPQPELH